MTPRSRWNEGATAPPPSVAGRAGACSTCGFFLPMAGVLRQVFGVCANEWSPERWRVVSLDHGCGAHSEGAADAIQSRTIVEVAATVVDETGYDDLGHS